MSSAIHSTKATQFYLKNLLNHFIIIYFNYFKILKLTPQQNLYQPIIKTKNKIFNK